MNGCGGERGGRSVCGGRIQGCKEVGANVVLNLVTGLTNVNNLTFDGCWEYQGSLISTFLVHSSDCSQVGVHIWRRYSF
jgi:hypothetical protein